MAKYRQIGAVVDAVQYLGESGPILEFLAGAELGKVSFVPSENKEQRCLRVETLVGPAVCKHGDYLVRGAAGELYPCKPDYFAATHQAWEPEQQPDIG